MYPMQKCAPATKKIMKVVKTAWGLFDSSTLTKCSLHIWWCSDSMGTRMLDFRYEEENQ